MDTHRGVAPVAGWETPIGYCEGMARYDGHRNEATGADLVAYYGCPASNAAIGIWLGT
jgi:hypothetical protein